MSAQKYNNNQAHVFWSDNWRPQADHDIYYSRWLCTPELKETCGSWGHELACVQTTPPLPSPLEKLEKALDFSWGEGGGVCTQASHEHIQVFREETRNQTCEIYARIQME